MTLYPIFRRPIAFRLERLGFPIIKIQQNKKIPEYNVYYFEDTVEFHQALTEVIKRREQRNT